MCFKDATCILVGCATAVPLTFIFDMVIRGMSTTYLQIIGSVLVCTVASNLF